MELAVRIFLAALFAWAGIAKLATLPRFATTLADHGIPRRARRLAGAAIGLAEMAIAALLAGGWFVTGTAAAAGSLCAVFAVSLLRVRLRGTRRTSCACFGGSRPSNTLVLTARAALMSTAAFVLASGLPDTAAVGTNNVQSVALLVLGVLTVALTLAVLGLYRQVGVLSLRLAPQTALELEDEGPPLGQPAPLLPGLSRQGTELVAFVSLNCRMCLEILPGLRALARDGLPVHWVREDEDPDAFERWAVPGTPYVVQITDGVVFAKGLVNTLEQIDWVLEMGEERHRHAA